MTLMEFLFQVVGYVVALAALGRVGWLALVAPARSAAGAREVSTHSAGAMARQ